MTGQPWRIVFFGTPSFALPTLESLYEGPDDIVAVVTQPDREKGRGRRVAFPPVKEFALREGLLLLQPERVREEAFQESLKKLEPDLFVVVAFGQIFPKTLLVVPRHGAVNVHASLLPKYRGAAPIAWAILGGERVTGVTTMRMDEGMDTGDILLQREMPIEEGETGESLQNKLSSLGARLLLETVAGMKAGKIHPVPQDHSKATNAPPLKKENGHIDWRKEAREIDLQVRAFNPWPVAFTRWDGRLLKVFGGEVREGAAKGRPGEVAWTGTDFVEVATGEGSFLIKEAQLEGKRRMSVRDLLSGYSMPLGTILQ